MGDVSNESLKPLAGVDGEAVFAEAWQAQALAIADTLVRDGLFTGVAWSEALGAALREAEAAGASDDQGTYYQCVLVALERLVALNSEIDQLAMENRRGDWEKAYLATPHGQPVELVNSQD